MAGTFRMTLNGTQPLLAALAALGDRAPASLGAALYEEGKLLLKDSLALVPRDIGNLAGSGYETEPDGVPPSVTVGYKGPYALSVHENPRSGHTGGIGPSGQHYKTWAQVGEWKYLETPFKARTAGFTARIAAALRATFLGGA